MTFFGPDLRNVAPCNTCSRPAIGHTDPLNPECDHITLDGSRRCNVHPEVTISSPDGRFDTTCGLCEAAADADDLDTLAETLAVKLLEQLGDGALFFDNSAHSLGSLSGPAEALLDNTVEQLPDLAATDIFRLFDDVQEILRDRNRNDFRR